MTDRTFTTLVVVSMALGLLFAYQTVNQYQVFVRAALGFATICLLFLVLGIRERIKSGTINLPAEVKLDLAHYLRFFSFVFIGTIFGFYAIVQIINLLIYLFDLIRAAINLRVCMQNRPRRLNWQPWETVAT